jgi:tungstate transport system substrate-binding protein
VHVIAVGTGKALKMGKDGDVDVLLVHAPDAEKKFIAAGYGVERTAVMHNDFVIVGSKQDPAKVSKTKKLSTALQQMATSKEPFVSRGDDSGTHKKERELWKSAALNPSGKWYIEAGQGMGKVLQMAGEMDAYTLTDRGTWLAYQDKSPLKIVFEGGQKLFNPYSIIAINPKRYADSNYQAAIALTHWLTSEKAQQKIADFTLHQQPLFIPDVIKVVSSVKKTRTNTN